jgi:hypothetical protein
MLRRVFVRLRLQVSAALIDDGVVARMITLMVAMGVAAMSSARGYLQVRS